MAKKLALVSGIVFIVIGLLAFIPNPIVGSNGFFLTNTLHDLVHIISGIVFLVAASKSEKTASTTLLVFGVVYLLVAILGLVAGGDGNLLGLAVNGADNGLHVVLAIVFIAGGIATKPKMMAATPSQTM